MIPYVAVGCTLLVLAVLEVGTPRLRSLWATIALLIVAGFGAFRFETGFDWMPYAWTFADTPTITTAMKVGLPEYDLPMEPLYIWLNVVIKTFSDNVTVLFALATLFGVISIHMVAGQISRSHRSFMWLVYFCLLFLAVQMSTVRIAIAASLVLIGLALAATGRAISGWLIIAVACGFHVFSAVFLPLPILRKMYPSLWWILVPVLSLGIVTVLFRIELADRLIDYALLFLPEFASRKLMIAYQGVEAAALSRGVLVLIAGYFALLYLFCMDPNAKRDPFIIVAIWLTFMVLSAHLFLWTLPAIWNRIMYVSLPWQIACLGRIAAFNHLHVLTKQFVIAAAGVAALASLASFLTSPAAVVFIPYQSVLEVWLTGNYGDGVERSWEWYVRYGEDIPSR